MSGGLYSMEERTFDTTLDLKNIKPYGIPRTTANAT